MDLLIIIYNFSIRTFVDTSKVKHLCDNQSGRTITITDPHVSTSYSNPQTTMFEPSLSPILVGDKIGVNINTNSRNPIKVWDSVSRAFVVEALRSSPYQVEVQEGHLRMAMSVSSTWGTYSPERLMEVLLDQNPGLPNGAITYVSQARGNGGRWTVFLDVSRQGMGFLRSSGFKLQMLLETVHLRPAEN